MTLCDAERYKGTKNRYENASIARGKISFPSFLNQTHPSYSAPTGTSSLESYKTPRGNLDLAHMALLCWTVSASSPHSDNLTDVLLLLKVSNMTSV